MGTQPGAGLELYESEHFPMPVYPKDDKGQIQTVKNFVIG